MSIEKLSSTSSEVTCVTAEFCVIGGGMAGLIVARRLAEGGRRVVVLESGQDGVDSASQELNRIVDFQGHYSRAMDGRYRSLGGSSSRWGGRLVPIYASDTEERRHLGLAAWPLIYRELERYQQDVESIFGITQGAFSGVSLETVGLDGDFPADDPDFAGRLAKWVSFRRCNLATLWRSALKRLDTLEVWLGATVTAFDLDRQSGRLQGVVARGLAGRSLRVRAEQFILAAGTIETTRLLLWLDRQSDEHAFARTRVLGRYFQDHLKAEVATIGRRNKVESNRLFGYHFTHGTRRSLHLDFSQEAQRQTGVSSAFVYAAMDLSASKLSHIKTMARSLQRGQISLKETAALALELPLVMRSAYWRVVRQQVFMPDDVRLGLQIAVEQMPHHENRIMLAQETDALGMPKAGLDWRPREADESTFRAVAGRLRAYWARQGLDQACPLDWHVDEADGDMAFTDRAEAYAHPSGSARMGTDPAQSVVRPDLFCHDVPNLSVASAAVFPTAGSANPTLTILELALRHADGLLARSRSPKAAFGVSYAGSDILADAMAPISASATSATSSSPI